MTEKKSLPLHTQIFIGLFIGLLAGLAVNFFAPQSETVKWVASNVAYPIGQIFLRLIFMMRTRLYIHFKLPLLMIRCKIRRRERDYTLTLAVCGSDDSTHAASVISPVTFTTVRLISKTLSTPKITPMPSAGTPMV